MYVNPMPMRYQELPQVQRGIAPAPRVRMSCAAPAAGRDWPLAISYTRPQTFTELAEEGRGLCMGTIYKELYLPLAGEEVGSCGR